MENNWFVGIKILTERHVTEIERDKRFKKEQKMNEGKKGKEVRKNE